MELKNKRTKKIISILLSVAMIFCGLTLSTSNVNAKAAPLTEGDFQYEVNDDTLSVTIVGYTGSKKAVDIPNTIDEKPVTVIGQDAFRSKKLESVAIPEGVIEIREDAFISNQLTSVTIPESVTKIRLGAFSTNQLTSVMILSKEITIGDLAFSHQLKEGNKTLERVVILVKGETPKINTDSYNIFIDSTTDNFKMYGYAGSSAEDYAKFEGGLFLKTKYDFVAIKELRVDNVNDQVETGSAITPELVVKDKDDANKTLTKGKDYTVTYKNNVNAGTATATITGIGDYKYAIATKTFKIVKEFEYTIQDGKVTITKYNGTDKTVDIPSTIAEKPVTAIGDQAFCDMGLTSVTFPSTVTSIGTCAFAGNQLTNVVLPSNLTSIKERAFANNQLINITIPKGVTTIDQFAFSGQMINRNCILKKVYILGKETKLQLDVFIDSEATDGFKMYGFAGSFAKEYAAGARYTFITLDEWLTIGDIVKQEWTGSAVQPTVVVKDKTDSSKKLVKDADYTIAYKNNVNAGTATATITGIGDYEYATATKEFTIASVNSIAVKTHPGKMTYLEGKDTLDLTGGQLEVTYSNNTKKTINMTETGVTSSGFNNAVVGTNTITFTYGGKTTTLQVTITAKQVSSIAIKNKPTKLTYIKGQDLDITGGKITVNYNNGTSKDIDITSNMISGYDKTKVGEQIVTVTYDTNKTATFNVTVKPLKYTFIEGTGQTTTAGNDKDLTFRIDGPLELLDKVYINDKELDTSNYTTASGSTIITLKKEYVSTLTAGTYTLKTSYTNGANASTTFEVEAKEMPDTPIDPGDITDPINHEDTTLPKTGDTSDMGAWVMFLILAVGATTVACRKKNR